MNSTLNDRFRTVYENTKAATVRVYSTCEYKTSDFDMDDAFDALRRLYAYVQGVNSPAEYFVAN